MEQRTKVRAKYLRFLEEERFDQLPGDTYTKGFLRVYADALGLDGQLYVDEYNSRFIAGEEEGPLRTRRAEPGRHRSGSSGASRGSSSLGVAVIAIVTALVIAAWRFGGTESPSVDGLERRSARRRRRRCSQKVHARDPRNAAAPRTWRSGTARRRRRGRALTPGTLEKGQVQRFSDTQIYLSVAKPARVVVTINGVRYLPFDGELNVSAATAVRG